MSKYYQSIIELVKEISGQKNTIGIPKIFIRVAGGLEEGVFLSQVVFWADQTKRDDGFFYRSAKEWGEEICLSQYQVNRIAQKLEGMGFIETKLMRANGAPTMHYKPNMDKVIEAIIEKLDNRLSRNLKIENQETAKSDYEETPKCITEKTQKKNTEKDYLGSVLNGKSNGVSEVTGSNPDDQWIEFGSKTVQLYTSIFKIKLNEEQRGALSLVAGQPGFEWGRFEQFTRGYALGGGYPYDVAKFLNGYSEFLQGKAVDQILNRVPVNGNSDNGNGVIPRSKDGGWG